MKKEQASCPFLHKKFEPGTSRIGIRKAVTDPKCHYSAQAVEQLWY
jgi:hypothetical protein